MAGPKGPEAENRRQRWLTPSPEHSCSRARVSTGLVGGSFPTLVMAPASDWSNGRKRQLLCARPVEPHGRRVSPAPVDGWPFAAEGHRLMRARERGGLGACPGAFPERKPMTPTP